MSTVKTKHTRDMRINGKLIRAWILRETDERILYIPVKSMHRVDYEWFRENDKRVPNGSDFLNYMAKTKAKNGQHALKLYEAIIQVAIKNSKTDAQRITKPDEAEQTINPKAADVVQPPAQQPPALDIPDNIPERTIADTNKEPDTTDPRTLAKAGIKAVYEFEDSEGKMQRWEAKKQGPYPAILQEKINQGLDPSMFRVE